MIMQNGIISTLDALATDLGRDEATSYVQLAHQRLAERCDALLLLLAQENWPEASRLAHKALGSVRSYDDGRLEALLLQVEQAHLAEIHTPAFRMTLQTCFHDILAGMDTWLQKNQGLAPPTLW